MSLAILHSAQEWSARFPAGQRSVVSVGTFDGLHLGHQQILRTVVERARQASQLAGAVTFDPHPVRVLRPEKAPRMIETLGQRLQGFERMGLDAALVLRFDGALSLLSPEEFLQTILVDCLRVAAILVGENFCFGHRGAGDVALLSRFGASHGFQVEIVPPVEVGGKIVSSTNVRNAVGEGRMEDAEQLLGRAFALTGQVRTGEGRGRTILFPTLNLLPEQELLPKTGVYATRSTVLGKEYVSVTNVGTRPTFDGRGITVESHLLGFAGLVTSGPMEVRFQKRLRDERKFSGIAELRQQISRDIEDAKEYFSQVDPTEYSRRLP
jgi:riboflavin kinase / FMN adenylyltransferase